MPLIDKAVAAIQAGKPVVLPTDTVYGLCTTPYREEPVHGLSALKGRGDHEPMALVGSDVDYVLECVPELRGRSAMIARELLPGLYTLVLRNPARRYRWLSGSRPDTIGIRVPELEGDAKAVLDRVGAVAATSANLHGEPDPQTLDEVPEPIRSACAAVIDGGELPGIPSTVIDFTGPEPVVLREGAGSVEAALSAAAAP
jgi:L-threonylcarbamoyladenylate synthase